MRVAVTIAVLDDEDTEIVGVERSEVVVPEDGRDHLEEAGIILESTLDGAARAGLLQVARLRTAQGAEAN